MYFSWKEAQNMIAKLFNILFKDIGNTVEIWYLDYHRNGQVSKSSALVVLKWIKDVE